MIHLKNFATEADYEAFVASGEMKKPNVSYVEETSGVHYTKALKKGVFIQHIDGTLYTQDEWGALGLEESVANGIAVSTDKAAFVVAKSMLNSSEEWRPSYVLLKNVGQGDDATAAREDIKGVANTKAMLEVENAGAAYACHNYIFPDGKTIGYLPSAGEFSELCSNITAVDAALLMLGKNKLSSNGYWSSTQKSQKDAWVCYVGFSDSVGSFSGWEKSQRQLVLPFGAL